MSIHLVSGRLTRTNAALLEAFRTDGSDAFLTTPEQLERVRAGDIVLGRLDVLPTLEGVEEGIWALWATSLSPSSLLAGQLRRIAGWAYTACWRPGSGPCHSILPCFAAISPQVRLRIVESGGGCRSKDTVRFNSSRLL